MVSAKVSPVSPVSPQKNTLSDLDLKNARKKLAVGHIVRKACRKTTIARGGDGSIAKRVVLRRPLIKQAIVVLRGATFDRTNNFQYLLPI